MLNELNDYKTKLLSYYFIIDKIELENKNINFNKNKKSKKKTVKKKT